MICPVCKKDMMVIEYRKVELDFCTTCKGVWFDAGELDLLLEAGGLKEGKQNLGDVLRLPEAVTAEKKRRCPICAVNMKKVRIGGDKGGEVADLLKIINDQTCGRHETEAEIMCFLQDVFPQK